MVLPVSTACKRARLSSKNRAVPIFRCLLLTHLLPPLPVSPSKPCSSSGVVVVAWKFFSSTTNELFRPPPPTPVPLLPCLMPPLPLQSTTSRRNAGLFTTLPVRLLNVKNKRTWSVNESCTRRDTLRQPPAL